MVPVLQEDARQASSLAETPNTSSPFPVGRPAGLPPPPPPSPGRARQQLGRARGRGLCEHTRRRRSRLSACEPQIEGHTSPAYRHNSHVRVRFARGGNVLGIWNLLRLLAKQLPRTRVPPPAAMVEMTSAGEPGTYDLESYTWIGAWAARGARGASARQGAARARCARKSGAGARGSRRGPPPGVSVPARSDPHLHARPALLPG